MWKELLTLKTADSLTSERIDHDRVLENMRDNVLADGCSAQEYSHRVKTLQRWHIPHLQRPFATDESLAEFLIDLMPEKNGHEGRDLKRRLKTAGTLTSVTAVAECTKIVRQTESASVRKAAAAAIAMQFRAADGLAPATQQETLMRHHAAYSASRPRCRVLLCPATTNSTSASPTKAARHLCTPHTFPHLLFSFNNKSYRERRGKSGKLRQKT